MTFSLLQSNYCHNLPTELLDYQLGTEHNHYYGHISPFSQSEKDELWPKLGINKNILSLNAGGHNRVLLPLRVDVLSSVSPLQSWWQ